MGKSSSYIDIDAAFSEQEQVAHDPIVVRLGGQEWTLPAVVSASAVLRIARWEAAGRSQDSLTKAEQLALVGDLVPDDIWQAWSRAGIGIDDPRMEATIMALLGEYMRRFQEGATEQTSGEAPAPASSPSSDAGASSKPTSSGSTPSSSPVPSGA